MPGLPSFLEAGPSPEQCRAQAHADGLGLAEARCHLSTGPAAQQKVVWELGASWALLLIRICPDSN